MQSSRPRLGEHLDDVVEADNINEADSVATKRLQKCMMVFDADNGES